MAKFCCVCSESKEAPDNQLFCCKGHGCDVTVHQACYGIVSIPSGLWFCRKCESQERAARVRCELCPRKEGALKRTDSGGWAHVVCALYIPEVTFGNNVRMEPIITSKLPRERFSKSCYLCEDQGLETQAGHGACMACHKSGCRLAFHVTCAQKERLLCEEEDSRDTRNIVYCGYCMVHFKKMIRQKYKQTLRKQPPTPTSSTAPPLPPTPTATTADTPSTPLPQLPSLPATKEPFERREAPKPIKKEKQKADLPQKRTSMDAPIPPPKQRKRRRKVSSSNESTTSETPSHASDIHHHLASSINANAPASPSLPATRSPLTVSEQALVSKPPKEVSESGSNEFLASSKDSQSLSLLPPHPLSPVSAALGLPVSSGGGGQFSMDVATGSRQTGSTSSDQSSASRAQAPPLSLHELLERQWEQTAQYILDQAGRQNNAGVMLAHLHQLQSENQRMQARIMELASQREFYIATNTRLSQTLAEQDGGRLPNGVQPPGEGIQQALQMAASSSSPSNGESTNRTLGASDTQGDSDHRHPVVVVSSSLPKAAQDSLLQAHFMATSLPQYRASSSSSSSKNTSVTTGTHKKEGSSKHHRSSQGGSQPDSRSRSTQELLQASAGGLRLENERSIQQQQQQPGGNHEITYVTNSIQAPITTYTPLPSDRSFLDSGSSWLFNRNGSSNPRSKS